MKSKPKITLYGTERCHKTLYYKNSLTNLGLTFEFKDVDLNHSYAEELRNLYINGNLNFPTITIGSKKLRNPSDKDLRNWIEKHL